MIRRIGPVVLGAALAFALGPLPAAASPQASAAADTADVAALVGQYQAARGKGDATALARLFTPDADQLVSSGEWRKGRDAVVKGSLASSEQTTGKRTMTVETVRRVGADGAIADLRYDITQNDGSVRHMWASWLLVKDGAAWKIAAIRNMLPAVTPR
jgi:uncharacterized protein (TIGR02246 family)